MSLRHARRLFDYNHWANRRLLEAAAKLSDEQFFRPSSYSIGSVHQQLVHMMGVEWLFLKRVQGISPQDLPEPDAFPTLDSTRAEWEAVRADWQIYLDTLNDARLDDIIHFTSVKPVAPRTMPLWEMLVHLINHATDHRAQTLAQIHAVGGETFAQDLIVFAWDTLPSD